MKKIILFILFIFAMGVFCYSQMSQRGATGTNDARYINVFNENDIFELDASGDVMPSVSGKIDAHFEEDTNGNIQPKDQDCFTQNADGDYQPVE